jgi:hypothetical protein
VMRCARRLSPPHRARTPPPPLPTLLSGSRSACRLSSSPSLRPVPPARPPAHGEPRATALHRHLAVARAAVRGTRCARGLSGLGGRVGGRWCWGTWTWTGSRAARRATPGPTSRRGGVAVREGKAVTWQSRGSHVAVTWQSRGSHGAVTGQSRGRGGHSDAVRCPGAQPLRAAAAGSPRGAISAGPHAWPEGPVGVGTPPVTRLVPRRGLAPCVYTKAHGPARQPGCHLGGPAPPLGLPAAARPA